MLKSNSQKLRQLQMKLAFKAIVLKGKITQALSLKLATKHAVHLFRTPIQFTVPQRELPMLQQSRKEKLFINTLQKEIMVYHYGESARKILLIHGWSGRGTQLYKIADMLVAEGFSVLSFDAPAHGQSSGTQTMMNEFVVCIRVLSETYGPFEYGIGHSLGGMALLNALNRNIPFKKAVCIGSGNSIFDIMKDFVANLKMKPVIAQRMKAFYDKEFGVDLETFSSYQVAKHIDIPVLIIHDQDDKDVPVSCAHEIYKNLKNGTLLITNGLGHRKILGHSEVLENIRNFIHA